MNTTIGKDISLVPLGAGDQPDDAKRGAILTGISERLLSISETVNELDRTVASQQTKDQDKQRLAEILRREEYQKPEVKDESLFAKWRREFIEWLGMTRSGRTRI